MKKLIGIFKALRANSLWAVVQWLRSCEVDGLPGMALVIEKPAKLGDPYEVECRVNYQSGLSGSRLERMK